MYRRVAHTLTFRTAIAFTICVGLLLTPGISFLISGAAQGQHEERRAKPKPGKPEGELPDLEDVKNESWIEREALPPIPSTLRSIKNPLQPWDGRRVGDPGTQGALGHNRTERGSAGSDLASNSKPVTEHRRNQTRRAHAPATITPPLPPPVPENQFVSNFFTWALTRSPFSNETTYWHDQLRVANANGQTSLKLAAIELGRTLFESAEYAARNRDNHWYVYDLFKTYLMRDPDAGGWAFWESQVPSNGREAVRRSFEESGEFATLIANMTLSGSPTPAAASLITARVDPRNQPGNGMLTRDASWSVPLLSLPGRNGLDLGLGLSYSSMVWTRSGPYIYFDEDNGFPSPGFRLGFPTVQRKVFDAQTAKNAYLMITAAGRRVELRHVSSNIYDAADSSLTEDCVRFLNNVLAQLKDPHSDNFRDILSDAKKRRLYTKRLTAAEKKKRFGGTHSRVGDPAFYIYLDEDAFANDPYLLIHELFHGADGSGDGYTHFQMANAAYNAAQADPAFMKWANRHGGLKKPRPEDYSRDPEDWYNADVFDSIARFGCTKPIDWNW